MIFRRLKAHIEKENWLAVGIDFAIVVIGVFIGIQVANWNEARQIDERRANALLSLQAQTEENIRIIQSRYSTLSEMAMREHAVSTALQRGGAGIDPDQLTLAFARVMYFSSLVLNQSHYDALNQSGDLAIINDPDVLIALNRFMRRTKWVQRQYDAFHPAIGGLAESWTDYILHRSTGNLIRTDVVVELDRLLADPVALSDFAENARMKAIFLTYLSTIMDGAIELCETLSAKTAQDCDGAETVLEPL